MPRRHPQRVRPELPLAREVGVLVDVVVVALLVFNEPLCARGVPPEPEFPWVVPVVVLVLVLVGRPPLLGCRPP